MCYFVPFFSHMRTCVHETLVMEKTRDMLSRKSKKLHAKRHEAIYLNQRLSSP